MNYFIAIKVLKIGQFFSIELQFFFLQTPGERRTQTTYTQRLNKVARSGKNSDMDIFLIKYLQPKHCKSEKLTNKY